MISFFFEVAVYTVRLIHFYIGEKTDLSLWFYQSLNWRIIGEKDPNHYVTQIDPALASSLRILVCFQLSETRS